MQHIKTVNDLKTTCFHWFGQRMTSGQTSRENYLNVPDRINVSASVTSSNQGAVASSPLNLGVLTNQIQPLPKFSGEVDGSKRDLLTEKKNLRW